ncbi:MAG: CHAD domain-containing protein [Thermomicrobiales bacterium]|jgi:CHAD domain-containing protein
MSRAWPIPELDPGAPLAANARRILAVRTAELYSYEPILPDGSATSALHNARIAAKRLRYSLELFASVFGDDGATAIEQIKGVQEDLGQLHDHDVRIALIEDELRSLDDAPGQDDDDPRIGLEALREREQVARAKRHTAVVKRWQRLERGGLRANLVALSSMPVTG